MDAVSPGDAPGPQGEGWANQQIWMGACGGHPRRHPSLRESFARGGVGQAGVEAKPFQAWIDYWQMRGSSGMPTTTLAPLELNASGTDFSYALRLEATGRWCCRAMPATAANRERGQASYYYSQPFFTVAGRITIDDKPVEVTGQAWMDREWSSQPLASDQTGWDWFSLHLDPARS